jgi:hypothetical protein
MSIDSVTGYVICSLACRIARLARCESNGDAMRRAKAAQATGAPRVTSRRDNSVLPCRAAATARK